MRKLHTVNHSADAEQLGRWLGLHRVDCELRKTRGGEIELWIADEKDRPRAQALLARYLDDPEAALSEVATASQTATPQQTSRKAEQATRGAQRRPQTVKVAVVTVQPVTWLTIGLCLVVAMATRLGDKESTLAPLLMHAPDATQPGWRALRDALGEGQLWRLVSPIFVHFGLVHFLMNMLWLRDLGRLVELRRGSATLAGLTLGVGAVSNVAQLLWSQSPHFGGFSGVIYGLLGYAWALGRLQPSTGLRIPRNVMLFMMGWFALCLTGLIGAVANAAHTAGLLCGLAVGATTALKPRPST